MTAPNSAREALIAEALGEVGALLDRVDATVASIDNNRLALLEAGSALDSRLKAFEAGTTSLAQRVQAVAIEHIVRRTAKATSESIEAQARAMTMAARTAFAEQVESSLAQLATSLQRALRRVDRPWDTWLTHAATAAVASSATWWIVSSFAGR